MNFDKWINPTIHNVVVGKQSISTHLAVSRDMLELAEKHADNVIRFGVVEEYPDMILGGLIYTMRSYLLKSTHNEKRTFSIEVPDTWWDHLKHDLNRTDARWARFLVRLLMPVFGPPKYRTEFKEFEVTIRLCPHNDSYLSEKPEEHFQWLTWEDDHASDK
jgi:hypothetical protein